MKFIYEENPFDDPEIAATWIKSVESEKDGPREKYIYPLIRKWLEDNNVEEVLDLGCGQGILSAVIAPRKYFGIDSSEALIKRAKKKYPDKRNLFVQGNLYDTPFGDRMFKSALSVNVWFHLEYPLRALQEMGRLLKPKSPFLVINPNPAAYSVWEGFYQDIAKTPKGFSGKVTIPGGVLSKNVFYTHKDESLLRDFEAAKLAIEESKAFARFETDGAEMFKYYSGWKI